MKKLTKALTSLLITSILVVPVFASEIILNINGSAVATTVAPYQSNGTTLVPLRVVSENLGAKVDWNQQTKTVTITQDATTINLTLGSKIAKVNGEEKTLNLAPQIKNSTTMVPIRFVSENLNCDVNWDKETQTVTVTGKAKAETTVNEDGSFVIKNPQMLAGVPVLTVDWMEKNLGAHVTYYPQWNRYSVKSSDRSSSITISEKNRWVSINSAKEPYIGDYDCGKDKSSAKISIDIVAKAYGYKWTYDKATKVLSVEKVKEEIVLQEPINGYVTVKGNAKYLDTLEPVANMPVIIYTRNSTGGIAGIDETTTDNKGYYEYKYKVPTGKDAELYTLEIQCINDSYRGVTKATGYPQGESFRYYQPYLRDVMPVIYVVKR